MKQNFDQRRIIKVFRNGGVILLFDVSFRIRFESTWRETSFSPRENDNLKIDRESNGESKGEGRYWKERGFIGEKGRRLDASVLTN